jgi:hypothetical protein
LETEKAEAAVSRIGQTSFPFEHPATATGGLENPGPGGICTQKARFYTIEACRQQSPDDHREWW